MMWHGGDAGGGVGGCAKEARGVEVSFARVGLCVFNGCLFVSQCTFLCVTAPFMCHRTGQEPQVCHARQVAPCACCLRAWHVVVHRRQLPA